MEPSIKRELLTNGAVRLSSAAATFEFTRPRAGTLLVKIAGTDKGQFGGAPFDEIVAALNRDGPLELFVDARDAIGAAVSVSDDWTRFFSVQRERLRRVHILAGSKAVRLTVAIAGHLSRTGELIQIYSDRELFESRLSLQSRG